ncbi:95cdee2a-69a2-406e-8d5c-203a7db946c5-CDS [Sclerotinia trifoliorum]|uniref:95cdee2a-69a2-406e-8d5c-203a7db946c5-CDS n=1 Tax=Sclerotinia trifoliorum TaxID=28548 RepID=A0A8H2VXB8_9HELO|nr:95cdee2a-69a2-406e-8d5c-203a7db946c5-CDS [Sclerotinia trifoliorum]
MDLRNLDRHLPFGTSPSSPSTALNLAFTTFLLSNILAWFFMIIIQYILFKALYQHRQQNPPQNQHQHSYHKSPNRTYTSTSSQPYIRGPSTGETYLFIGGLWMIYGFVDAILTFFLDTVIYIITSRETGLAYTNQRNKVYNMRYWAGGVENGMLGYGRLFVLEVITTWFLSQIFILVSDVLIPLYQELQRDHRIVVARMQSRVWELEQFVRMMDWKSDCDSEFMLRDKEEERKGSGSGDEGGNGNQEQIIELSRQRSESLENGDNERKLDWRLVIDEDALNEMKEMLGPPGGFGELGFSVARDRVCLGAVSRGSSFMVTFGLEGCEDQMREGGGRDRKDSRDGRGIRDGRRGVDIPRKSVSRGEKDVRSYTQRKNQT